MAQIVKAPDVPRDDVFILGAGFSRAAYPGMPLTNDLGTRLLARLDDEDLASGRPVFTTEGLTFEAWLSWLGETQPFDTVEEAHRRRATFARVLDLIGEELDAAERDAMKNAPPAFWLYPLIQLFQLGLATVVTFNYDRVIETNIPQGLTDSAGELIFRNDVVVPLFTPASVFLSSGVAARNVRAFDYLKLHGSIDWWVYPGDQTGSSLEQGPRTEDLSRAERNLRGTRTRFIVPPTAQKSAYYGSELTHLLWQRAAAALRGAERVVVLGYSLPTTDNAAASLLAGTVGQSQASVHVVNPAAREVAARLASLGVVQQRVEQWTGDEAIKEYVAERTDKVARAFAARFIESVRQSDCLAFAWNANKRAAVEQARLESDGTVLVLTTSLIASHVLVRADAQVVAETPRAMSASSLPNGWRGVDKVVVEHKQWHWPAVGTVHGAITNEPEDDQWMTLYPLGAPPEL